MAVIWKGFELGNLDMCPLSRGYKAHPCVVNWSAQQLRASYKIKLNLLYIRITVLRLFV